VTTVTERPEPARTTDVVAKAVGIGSGRTYERHRDTLAQAAKVAPDGQVHQLAGGAVDAEGLAHHVTSAGGSVARRVRRNG